MLAQAVSQRKTEQPSRTAKGVDVGEAACAGPHGDHDEVDEDGDCEPAEAEVPAYAAVGGAAAGEDGDCEENG